ncbi:Helix-turn-helix domain-containing protein [Actinopolyspora xinjiangensis]|uniref:Helix-turn-helix domain-containing protein n=1 Tax=Actinopolyspora xinjiangensis TaxID=405564 RepID=A0A1H0N7K8_9ACTN|nr:helix-turn-helix transcriptional regulator [Actinopolyspora xinjiangensis]SDO88684.1 Helix-turn-helix domain-containing protein [Actinopolyspora xinjiangensis]
MERSDPSALRWLIGNELRHYRTEAGETVASAARALGCSAAKITHLETGRYQQQPDEMSTLLIHYGVARHDIDRLTSLAASSNSHTWWAPWANVVPDWLKTFVGLEGIACSEFIYMPLVLPGLLQTAGYAAALTSASVRVRTDHSERFVNFRLARQQRLLAEDSLRLTAVLEESILDRPVGDREVMNEQLRQLASTARRDNVDIRVLPTRAGPHAALSGGFTVLNFAQAQSIGYIELQDGAVYIQNQEQVADYTRSGERLLSTALSPDDSVAAIEERID